MCETPPSLEADVALAPKELTCFAWAVVQSGGATGRARTATFALPPAVDRLVAGGMELGDADDKVFSRVSSKSKNGAVGLLTNDLITRELYYEHAALLALVPFVHAKLWDEDGEDGVDSVDVA